MKFGEAKWKLISSEILGLEQVCSQKGGEEVKSFNGLLGCQCSIVCSILFNVLLSACGHCPQNAAKSKNVLLLLCFYFYFFVVIYSMF